MTYTELESAIQLFIDNDDPKGMLALITLDNINTITKCVKKPTTGAIQQLGGNKIQLDAYLQLLVDLDAAANVAAAMAYFIPSNVLLASYGVEYEARYTMLVTRLTNAGGSDPEGQATTALADEAEARDTAQNSSIQPVDACL